ncbi:MAG: type II secretion system protein GspM, partial [Paracoccaceae bacterium]
DGGGGDDGGRAGRTAADAAGGWDMMAFWAARTARERVLLACLAVVCLGYALIVGVWQPLQRQRDGMSSDIARYMRTAEALSAAAAQGVAFVTPASDAPLPAVITDTAAGYQLVIRRLQPTANAAEITLEDAGFEAVMLWLEALERDHGLRVMTLTMTRRPEPGLVATVLTVGR